MFWIVLVCLASAAQALPVCVCVTENLSSYCSKMQADLEGEVSCVTAPDVFGCVAKVASKQADFTNVDANGLYLAGKFFDLRAIVMELVDGETYRYQGVAVVEKGSNINSLEDLKGKKSCHTGYRRTVGWQIPVARLLEKGAMEPTCEEADLAAVNGFFGGSCVPGNWSADEVVDALLKEKYPNLCSQCEDPKTCSSDDTHAGYEGVMQCLAAGNDVAFTKLPVAKLYAERNTDFAEKYELLCLDGHRKDILDPEPCTWGNRPTNAFVARKESEEEMTRLRTTLLKIQTLYSNPQGRIPDWYHKSFLSRVDASGIQIVEEDKNTYASYLGDFLQTIRMPRPHCTHNDRVTFCVVSGDELQKCQNYSWAAEARGVWPCVECIRMESEAECVKALNEGLAHLLILDAGHAYRAGRYHGLPPLARETYDETNDYYYAVALVRSDSTVDKVSDLKGLRSCHTGIGHAAGWIMPLYVLQALGEIKIETSDRLSPIANFFSAGSCVPGANDIRYNPDKTKREVLCKHCIGDDQGLHKCARDSRERFSGYAGAFRCLAEGKGDVAFVKDTTALEYTDGRSSLSWAKDLISSDFKLLCADNNGTAAVTDYSKCNWGKVPSHQVVAKLDNSSEEEKSLQLVTLLADSSQYFSRDSKFYKLFFRRKYPDVMFKDSANRLKIHPRGSSYEQVLGPKFVEAAVAADPNDY